MSMKDDFPMYFKQIEYSHVQFLLLSHKASPHLREPTLANLSFVRAQMGPKNQLKQTGSNESGATMKLAYFMVCKLLRHLS